MMGTVQIPKPHYELPNPYEARATLYRYTAWAHAFSYDRRPVSFDELLFAVDFDTRSTALAIASVIDVNGQDNINVPSQKQFGSRGLQAYFDTFGDVSIEYGSFLIFPRLDIRHSLVYSAERNDISNYFAHEPFGDRETVDDRTRYSNFLQVSSRLIGTLVTLTE